MTKSASVVLLTSLLLAACGGGGGGSSAGGSGFTPSGSTSPQTDAGLPVTPATVATANEVGSTLQSFTRFETAQFSAQASAAVSRSATARVNGLMNHQCTATGAGASVEMNTPDLNGDPNSNEVEYFYDSACASLARDTVRHWTAAGPSSEYVTTTQKQYANGFPSSPVAVRSDAVVLTNATFTSGGYPLVADGYDRSSTGALYLGSTKVLLSDFDLVMSPQDTKTHSSTFCSDDAGFNIAAVDTTDGLTFKSYGWSAVVSSGSRTVNTDGSVTWTGTHNGYSYSGPAGSISFAAGQPNTTCPITTPEFSVMGPNFAGKRSMTVTAQYLNGMLENLNITNASLDSTMLNGQLMPLTLNVSTNRQAGSSSSQFITGTISASGTTLAVFNVDAFGDGTLTVKAAGSANQFVLTDWHVMHNPAAPA